MLQKVQWDSLQQRRARSHVLMYRIRYTQRGGCYIPALTYVLPSTKYSPHQKVWNQAQTDTVQHKYLQSYLPPKCKPIMEHSAIWRLPATTRELWDSEHHPTDVDTCRPCLQCTRLHCF